MSRVAWLFPGQGSQQVGMGKELSERHPAAARTFDEASEALGWDLRKLCWEGPAQELDLTANAQPAIVTTSIAALRYALEAGLVTADDPLCLGHSVGEYSALVAAGALSLADGVRLVRSRGELMHRAATGGMAAVIGTDAAVIGRVLDGTGVVIANDNAPGQVVISGPLDELASVGERLRASGAKRVVPLRVSGAFHSPLLRPFAPELRRSLDAVEWHELRHPVVANVDGAVHEHARDFPDLLERQLWSPVRWVDSVRRAAALGTTEFVELGAGTVLAGLVRRILPEPSVRNIG